MNQDQLIILLFKVVILADVTAIAAFLVIYSVLAPWWRNEIGRTIAIKDILLGAALTPSVLSFFLHFNRLTSYVAAWVDIGLFGLIAVVMIWRSLVWVRIHRRKKAGHDDSGA